MFQISHHCTSSPWWHHCRHCKHIFCQSLTVSRPCSLLVKLTHGWWNKTLSPNFTAKRWKSKFEVNIINFEPIFENMNIVIIIQPVALSWRRTSLFVTSLQTGIIWYCHLHDDDQGIEWECRFERMLGNLFGVEGISPKLNASNSQIIIIRVHIITIASIVILIAHRVTKCQIFYA